jgi:hypothetical protein
MNPILFALCISFMSQENSPKPYKRKRRAHAASPSRPNLAPVGDKTFNDDEPFERLFLPHQIETMLVAIRNHVRSTAEYFEAMKTSDETMDDTLLTSNRNREQEILLYNFDKDDIRGMQLVDCYLRCVEKYVKAEKGIPDGDTCTEIAFKVYVDLCQHTQSWQSEEKHPDSQAIVEPRVGPAAFKKSPARAKTKSRKDGAGV